MSDEIKVAQKTRRAFVKTAAQVAVTAPAVVMLLDASTKPAAAGTLYRPVLPQEEPILPNDSE